MPVELEERIVEVELFADYFQVYLQDDDISKGNYENSWTEEAVSRLLAVERFVAAIGTVRNMNVPVRIILSRHHLDRGFDRYDLVNQCGLEIETGRIVVAGCTDYFYDALRIEVPAGYYELKIGYGDLDCLSDDGLDGDDFYDIHISPARCPIDVRTLKDARKLDS